MKNGTENKTEFYNGEYVTKEFKEFCIRGRLENDFKMIKNKLSALSNDQLEKIISIAKEG